MDKSAAPNFIGSVSILGSMHKRLEFNSEFEGFSSVECIFIIAGMYSQPMRRVCSKACLSPYRQSRHPLRSRSAGRHSVLYASPMSSRHKLHKFRPVSRQLFPSLAMEAASNGEVK